MEDLTGREFGPYRIIEPCGEGGMAAVYKAYQANMDRYVALKVLPSYFARDKRYLGRFDQEAKVLARLQNAYILPVHDYGQHDGYTYFVMPYVESGSLAKMMHGRPLPLDFIVRLVTQLADALDYAHAEGVVHRDVKPSNILLDTRGNALLTDFGIAKIVQSAASFTQTGGILGTPAYMSPEQIMGETLDGRSDVYSLGIVLYEMVTGRAPYRAETPAAIFVKHLHDPLPLPRQMLVDLPDAVERVILRSLAKERDHRFQTAGKMAEALAAAVAGRTDALIAIEPDLAPPPPTEIGVPSEVARRQQEAEAQRVPATQSSEELHWEADETEVMPQTPPAAMPAAAPPIEAPPADRPVTPPPVVPPVPQPQVVTPESPVGRPMPSEPPEPVAPASTTRRRPLPVWAWLVVGAVGLALIGLLASRLVNPPAEELAADETGASATQATGAPGRPTATPQFSVGSTRLRGRDGMRMLYVPAGSFLMGSEAGEPGAKGDEYPQHEVHLDAFWMDETEVTNQKFARFLNVEGNQGFGGTTWLDLDAGGCLIEQVRGEFRARANYEAYPVVEVNWNGARAYCEWVGGRLPTEAEWEYAARGRNSSLYPWGDEKPQCGFVQYGQCSSGLTTVGSFPAGTSWVGALDLGGNAWEWVADYYGAGYYRSSAAENPGGPREGQQRVLRGGGGLTYVTTMLRTAARRAADPYTTEGDVGFRCVMDPAQ